MRGAGEPRILADLVSLVRHAALDEDLEPYPERVQRRYQEWLAAQAAAGRQFTPQQRWWLDEIARHIGINVSISLDDLNYLRLPAARRAGGRAETFRGGITQYVGELEFDPWPNKSGIRSKN